MSRPDFSVEIFQNEYLPDGAREVNAIVTVTSAGAVASSHPPVSAAEIIIVDCSGSMGEPDEKLVRARAEAELGRAVALAHGSDNTDTAGLLAKVVDFDPATGVARLRAKVADADEMALDTRSSKTVRIKK